MPDQNIVTPAFSSMEFEIEPFIQLYKMAELVQHALSKTMGYYEAGEQFKFLRVNSSGELLVSGEGGQVSSGVIARATVTNVATLLIAANTSRKNILIFNEGTEDIYIGFDSGLTTVNGFLLPVGMSWSSDVYIGDVFGVRSGSVSCTAHIMEL